MARLYYTFFTKLKADSKGNASPNLVSQINLKTRTGNILRIRPNMDIDWSCKKQPDYPERARWQFYDCRWKGLEYDVEAPDGTTIVKTTDKDNTLEFQDLLKGATIDEIFVDAEKLADHGYPEDYVPKCDSLSVHVMTSDHGFNEVEFSYYREDNTIPVVE